MDPVTRIVALVLGVAFLVVYYGWRWRRAGQHVEAREQFIQGGQDNYLALKQHPKAQELLARASERHRASFDVSPDPQAYRIVWLALIDDRATCYRVTDIDKATWLVGYLYRDTDPKQIMVSMKLATGETHDTIPPYGWNLPAPS